MTEHEILNDLFNRIGYNDWIRNYTYIYGEGFYRVQPKMFEIKASIQELIFNPEFMDKFSFYLVTTVKMSNKEMSNKLGSIVFLGLNNPIEFLSNLIK